MIINLLKPFFTETLFLVIKPICLILNATIEHLLATKRLKNQLYRSSRPGVFCEKVAFINSQNSQENSQENTCTRVSFLIKLQAQAYIFIKKETLPWVFSCKFCKISKNTFSYKTPPVAASGCILNS